MSALTNFSHSRLLRCVLAAAPQCTLCSGHGAISRGSTCLDVAEDGGLHIEAGIALALASTAELSALRLARIDITQDLVELFSVHLIYTTDRPQWQFWSYNLTCHFSLRAVPSFVVRRALLMAEVGNFTLLTWGLRPAVASYFTLH